MAHKGKGMTELTEVQNNCDHDWEYFDTTKQCTYPECQLELAMSKQELVWAISEADGGN